MAYLESVIIRDTGGTEADVTAANALKVDGSAVTQPVNVVSGSVAASVDLQQDVFGQLVIANRYNQFEINYDTTDPDSISEITVTKTSGGDASNLNGQAVFTSNANTNGGVKAVTNLSTTYRPNSETYAAFTAIWPSGGLANSYQRIGIYDANNGFFIGYEGTAFGITLRKAAVDSFIAQAAWNVDTLTGGVGSKYTRNGVPEAIDFTKDNLFRVRYGWLGAAPIYWEVLSPDGEWVLFDIYRHPNTTGGTTINNPDLPMTLDIQKTGAGATVLTMNTACWAAGTTSPYTKISSTITDNTLANMSRSVITGRASTGGGTYYNVKVTPSGALVTAPPNIFTEDDPHTSGDSGAFVLAVRNDSNTAMTNTNGDYSPIAVNANGAIAINDGGNSITIDGTVGVSGTVTVSGTVAATQSGTWILGANSGVDIGDVTVNNGAGAAAVNIQDGGNSITVDGTVAFSNTTIAVTNAGTFAVQAAQSGTWILGANSGVDIGDVTINNAGGASAVNIQDGGNSITVDGTIAATQSGTWNVVAAGDVAHDSPDSGNPVKIGFQAETVLPAAVANGDRTNGTADQFGRQLVTHISPGMQTWKSANYTTTQTGVALWTPAAGKTVAVTYLAISSYATTTGRVIVWFGASGDTTYTAGTDQLVWAGSFAPGASSKPGAILNFPTPVFSANVDYVLRVTTDANISLDVSVYGYEF
jgi:hypothetical protein